MRPTVSYLFALACTAAALLLTRILGSWAEADFSALFMLAVLASALAGGVGPGLLATVAAAAGAAYAEAGWSFAVDIGRDDVFRISVFIVAAVIVSSLVAQQRAAETRLREADAAKDRVLATLSHELRTPLTSILGWASILEERDLDPATMATAIDSIKQSARSQQIIVDDLLDLSRIVLRKFRLDIAPVDLVPLVRSAVDLTRPVARERGLDLRSNLAATPCFVEGDAQRIKQVVWNLLSNAVKFTPAGGRIDVRLGIIDHDATIVVSDNGEGIAPESLPFIFDRFQQGESAHVKGGLGLGLAIARYVVEAHHGTIRAHSDGRGKGATLIVRLPLATPAAQSAYSDAENRLHTQHT